MIGWCDTRARRQTPGGGSAKTFVVADKGPVAGYFNLTVGQVDPWMRQSRFANEWAIFLAGGHFGAAGGLCPRPRARHWIRDVAGRHQAHVPDCTEGWHSRNADVASRSGGCTVLRPVWLYCLAAQGAATLLWLKDARPWVKWFEWAQPIGLHASVPHCSDRARYVAISIDAAERCPMKSHA